MLLINFNTSLKYSLYSTAISCMMYIVVLAVTQDHEEWEELRWKQDEHISKESGCTVEKYNDILFCLPNLELNIVLMSIHEIPIERSNIRATNN